jgi:sulfite reductase alpha subunit-like flavoprotein
MYVSAVRQLFGHIYKRHGWGMRLWNMLDDEKLKIYWTEYWSAQGLDYNVLSMLFDYVIDIVRHMAKRKYDIASSVRRNRLLSALS